MLVQLAVADASSIIILPLVLEPQRAGVTALGAAAVLLVAAVFSMVLMWARRTGYWHRVHHLSEERGLAIELRMTLTMLFALAAIAVSMGVSVMLAGFAMGLAMAAAHEPHRVANQTFAITQGFFEPIFFVWVGSSLDLHSLIADPQAILLGICLAVASLVAHGRLAVSHPPLPGQRWWHTACSRCATSPGPSPWPHRPNSVFRSGLWPWARRSVFSPAVRRRRCCSAP
jgi:Kef-type K+ transport system membrane component KefB